MYDQFCPEPTVWLRLEAAVITSCQFKSTIYKSSYNLLSLDMNYNIQVVRSINRQDQGVSQSQTAANSRHQGREKKDKNKHVQNKQTNLRD